MAEGGNNAMEVFRKTLPKLIYTLGKDPPFSIVTASLNAEDLITKQELEAIQTKHVAERGSEVGFKLTDKIKESDDPNACLLTICDIFESKKVDNAILKKHGENMRASISNGAAATPAQVPTVTPSAPPFPPATAPRTNPNELSIADLMTVLSVLSQAMFGPVHWADLGLSLGLYMRTLNLIGRANGDANDYLKLTLQYWLEKKDKVTGTTWHDLIRAVKSTGDNAAAERILGILISSEQLHVYDVMSKMSDSLPRYIIDHYIRLLTIVNVKSDMKPDWSPSKRFLELYSTHASETSPTVAATYVHKILTGLGYEEIDEHDFSVYLHIELEIDTKITEELEKITEFRLAVIEVVRELDLKLRDYQMNRYRMVLTVLRATVFDSNKSFFEYFIDLTLKLGKYPLAVAFTIGVLERSGWGDTKKLKPFSLPEFDLNTAYPQVDLCLTVADYYGNMSERDFSSAKVYTSSRHLNNQNVSKVSRVQFTLLLMERGVVKVGDVSKIEDTVRYPIFFKEYKERSKGPSKETAPTTETVTQETVTQETVVAQKTVAQATSSQSPSTPTDQAEQPPAAEKEFPGTAKQINTPSIPQSTDPTPAPTISNTSAAKEVLAQKYIKMTDKLKNSIIPKVASQVLTVKSLDEVKSRLTLVCKEADWKKEVNAVTDEASLRELLQRYCFLSNFSLLKCITEKLGLKESKLEINELAKERDVFYSEVLAKDFAAAAIEDHILIEEHHVEMTVVVSWPSSETTLATFEDYITKEFKDLSMFIALRAVHHSWIKFLCTLPVWAIGAISSAALGLGHALNGIQQFILNNVVIYGAPIVPAPIPPPDLFPKEDDKEYEKKLPDDLVKNIVKDICILLMTATENELRGVLGYLKPLDGRDKVIKSFIKGTWIYVGKYGEYSVVVGRSAYSKSQQGGLDAFAVTNKIMEISQSKYIIAIGVCFGMDRSKVNLGDVIVSDFIVDLSDFRKEPRSIAARKPQPPAGVTLSPLFGDTSEFKMKHSDEENAKEVKVHCVPIVTSPALVDDEEFKKQLREVRPDALAGEMEGAAIFSAARHAHHKPEAIVIKAVGDWADGKKDGCRGWKDFASHTAARYVHHHLDNVSLDALK